MQTKIEIKKLTSYKLTAKREIDLISQEPYLVLWAKIFVAEITKKPLIDTSPHREKILKQYLTLTNLYRVEIQDNDICATWMFNNVMSCKNDILALEINFSYVVIAVYIEDEVKLIPITFYDGELPLKFEKTYEEMDWVKKMSLEDAGRICDMAIEKFPDSEREVRLVLKNQ